MEAEAGARGVLWEELQWSRPGRVGMREGEDSRVIQGAWGMGLELAEQERKVEGGQIQSEKGRECQAGNFQLPDFLPKRILSLNKVGSCYIVFTP